MGEVEKVVYPNYIEYFKKLTNRTPDNPTIFFCLIMNFRVHYTILQIFYERSSHFLQIILIRFDIVRLIELLRKIPLCNGDPINS